MSGQPTESEKSNSTQSRLQFSLGKFSQAVGITENGLNASLALNWQPNDVNFELKAVDDDNNEYVDCTISGKMKAPTVEIGPHATDGFFYLHFGQCNINFKWFDGKNIILVSQDFANWALAYAIDFSFEKIARLPEAQRKIIKEEITNYSPHRLFTDFSNANLLVGVPDRCQYPGIDDIEKKGRREAIKDKVKAFAEKWIEQQQREGKNCLGYNLVADDSSKYPQPTLVPTAATLQSYPYYKNGRKVDSEYVRENSAFCFLNMYNHINLPTNNAGAVDTLVYSGNLVTPFAKLNAADSSPMAASFCIDGHALWHALTPKLKDICKLMFYSANTVQAKSDTNMDNCSISYSVGMGSNMTAEISDPTDTSGTAISPFGLHVFSITTKSSKHHYDSAGPRGAGGNGIAGAMEGWLDATGTCAFIWTPGSGTIKVVGSSSFTFKYHQRVAATWWGTNTFKAGWSWSYDLNFATTATGTLALTITNLSTVDDPIQNDTSFGYTSDWSVGDVKKWFDSTKVPNPLNALNNALHTSSKFVLPAAGQYWMQDPVLSNNGDLLVGMTLKPW